MANESDSMDRRPQHVAAMGFALHTAVFGLLTGVSIWKQSDAIATLARFAAIGLPIWAILYLVFKQVGRVAAEQLETAELNRARQAGANDAIFELEDEALLLEQNKLRWMLRVLLPAVTVLLALKLIVGQFVGWDWTLTNAFQKDAFAATGDPMLIVYFVVGTGFFCYLFGRWALALSRLPNWRLLRAGAANMAAIALACLLLAAALLASDNFAWAEPLFAYIVRAAMFLLGIEFIANFILDFYRPRTPGTVQRPSFDSRILSLIGEPGGVAKSIADTVNYQFGFEVSSTWFYQLLQRCLFPLMVGTGVIVILLSSIVVVNADEAAVIERWGQPLGDPPRVVGPGIAVKYPFPIDIVHKVPAKRIGELVIGEAGDDDDHEEKAIIWTEAHKFVPELMLLVGSPQSRAPNATETKPDGERDVAGTSVPVSLLMVSVPIEYRIKDVRSFLYTYVDPEKVMEHAAYEFLSEYAASVDTDQLMGPGRTELNKQIEQQLQAKLDELSTGIEVVFAGIRGAHPPAQDEVAKAFLDVITAESTKSTTINAARGEAHKILTAVAGTETRAKQLDAAIIEMRRLEADESASPEQVAQAKQRVDDLLIGRPFDGIAPTSGEVAKRIANAKATAVARIADAAAKVRAFSAEVAAFEAAPELYIQRKMLDRYADIYEVRKYMIVGDPESVIIEYETEQKIGLDSVLSDETGQ